MSKKVYNDLKEVADAFKSGELEGYELWLDNDCSGLQFVGEIPFEEDTDEYYEYQDKKADAVEYNGDGYRDLQDACEAAGIPCSWV